MVCSRKGESLIIFDKKSFRVIMRHFTYDSLQLSKKIGKKGYRFKNIIQIVQQYNQQFQ